ncbi:Fc.00g089350.m01.CDS01 [Cosmosporella sp. VM-42]
MAVKNEGDIYPTESLLSKKDRKHYRIPVRSQHWQLRSLISAEKQNIVYFPGGNGSNHVQRLNTTTHECETIKLLTFAPRCLVAENGWLCCGGENGEFVAMRVNDNDLDPDDAQLLESASAQTVLSLLSRGQWPEKSLVAKSVKLAKDRVNCITLWFPPTTMEAGVNSYTEPVAILANNDRTVTLVSLEDFEQKDKPEALDVITYPDFVNRAIISPDGRILVAILDDPYLYVHHRVRKHSETPRGHRGEVKYQWEQTQRILLKSQRKDDTSDSRGSFAACFSNSGEYLAVGTQHGTISIFATDLIPRSNCDPLITTFQSSRPQSGPGAVRDMLFCPGPYDILAWTEDRGHIGVADMRSGFIVRQIVNINDPSFDHINVLDRHTIDPRLLETRGTRRETVASALASNQSLADQRRRSGDSLDNLNTPLTANETLVLEAMQSDRRRRERAAQRAAYSEDRPAGAPNSFWTDRAARARRDILNDDDSPRVSERRSTSIGRAMEDLLPRYREPRERYQERVRRSNGLLRDATDPQPSTRRPEQRVIETLGETVAAMRDQRDRQDSSYLTILEILQARDRTPGDRDRDRDQDDTSLLVPLVNQVVTRWEESAIRGTLAPDHGVFEVPPSPDNTAGLAWSEDGRIL